MTFDHPTDPSRYRFGDDYLVADIWDATIRVKGEAGVEIRTIPFTATIHGPLLATSEDGKPLSFRIARSRSGTRTEQFYRMHKARTLEEWKEAVALRGLTYHNLMYADRTGNIFYLYNGNVPVRDDSFDWTHRSMAATRARSGRATTRSTSLPQLLNPVAGYLQNANSTPFVTTHEENPDPANYPRYMTSLENGDTYRGSARGNCCNRPPPSLWTTCSAWPRARICTRAADENWLPALFASGVPRSRRPAAAGATE
jgi:acyl-homoserine-lactone acylase